MEEEITHKLKIVQNKIRKIIESVESNECVDGIIVQISKAKKTLLVIRRLILKDYLIKVTKQTGPSKKEILKYYNLIN